jgi:DNA-binding SARP family transcriptional activator
MPTLSVHLFGKFCVRSGQAELPGFESRKVQELFGYLALYCGRPHPRETLAALLWNDVSTAQSKTYLRKVLWQLQTALEDALGAAAHDLLRSDADWLQISPQADLWLDVAELERAFALARGVVGEQLSPACAEQVQCAVERYQGDLLEGWYQDWCLYERERLQGLYLAMLDKLMGYCEASARYEQGIAYGALILRHDRAREQTHRRLMRLHSLSGDRTAALRQYDRCMSALAEELGVEPTDHTALLCEQIRANLLRSAPELAPEPAQASPALPGLLDNLKQIQSALAELQQRLQREIRSVEQAVAEIRSKEVGGQK